MRKTLSILLFALIAGVLCLVWWRYVPLADGEYVVCNNRIAWHMTVSNGVLRTTHVEGVVERLEVQPGSADFALRIGHAKTIGWAPEHKKPTDRYPPYMVRDGVTVTPENCRAVRLIRGWRTWKFMLHQPQLNCNVYLVFRAGGNEPWLRRRIMLQACNPQEELATDQAAYHVRWNVKELPALGGRGQPLFLDDTWFIGLEHPHSENLYDKGTVVLKQYPGYRFGVEPLPLQSMVVGCGERGAVRGTVNRYVDSIRRPPRSLTLCNTWCDLRKDELTEDNMAKSAEAFRANLLPYDASLDAYVIDDGWFNPKSIWKEDESKLPRGILGVRERIEGCGMSLGLWLPLNGHSLDTSWGAAQGYEKVGDKFYCMSATNYNAALRRQLKKLIREGNLQYFKHDFNYFWCGHTRHGHFPSREQSTEANVDALLSLLKMEARENPDIFLAITTGIWPSPWWLPYVDTIWMGGADYEHNKNIPATRGSAFEMNYRDGRLYELLVAKGLVFPLSALMTHGIVDGRHVGYRVKNEDDEGWANYVMNYLGRGTMMRECYMTPSNLTEKRWEILARGLRWADAMDACMVNAHFILGDPRRG